MITIAVLSLLGILLLVFLVLSAKSWKILHLMLLFMVYALGAVCLIFLSHAFKQRIAWQAVHKKNMEILEKQQEKLDIARNGPRGALKLDSDSLEGASTLLELELIGQGRIWPFVQPGPGPSDDTLKLTVIAPVENSVENSEPAASADSETEAAPPEDGAEAPSNSLKVDMILYAFRNKLVPLDLESPDYEILVADRYIGSIIVKSVDGNTAVVEALHLADPEAANSESWALYERMPVEKPDTFRRAAGFDDEHDPSDPNVDHAQYLTKYRNYLKLRMPATDLGIEDPVEYESFIDQYAFDGMRMDVIQNWLKEHGDGRIFDPSPNQIFERIKFNKKSREFRVNNKTATLKTEDHIDSSGLSVNPALKLESDSIFLNADDEMYVDKISANDGIKVGGNVRSRPLVSNKATVLHSIYRRRIPNYPYLLEAIEQFGVDLDERKKRIDADFQQNQSASGNLRSQISSRTARVEHLQADRENLQSDLSVIEREQASAEQQLADRKKAIRALYAESLRLHQEIMQASPAPVSR